MKLFQLFRPRLVSAQLADRTLQVIEGHPGAPRRPVVHFTVRIARRRGASPR